MEEQYDITQQIEPVRRSFLDVLRDNLRIAERVTFVHRLIYIGEHTFNNVPGSSIGDCMEKIVQKVNEGYHEEPLSGLLLFYPRYFCHIIEGAEDTLHEHLVLLTNDRRARKRIERMKMLVCYHHINQRFMPGWMAMTGKPPTLVERIDINCDLYIASSYVYNCVQKLYKLALSQRPKLAGIDTSSVSGASDKDSGSITSRSLGQQSEKRGTAISFVMEKYPECLPEYGLLDFLLSTPYTQSLENYIQIYNTIKSIDAYKDKVWPVPTEFVPFNVFDKVYDPITDLPTGKAAEQEQATDILD